uniref:Uncharacterized protein n=1 Tax=Rousettus aegyptiacus TaxID=9407 RepID=A0A7J8FJ05_ROUAE|nr:hypothetical protein HJG63_011997 [Rousettus aegyptiacus]
MHRLVSMPTRTRRTASGACERVTGRSIAVLCPSTRSTSPVSPTTAMSAEGPETRQPHTSDCREAPPTTAPPGLARFMGAPASTSYTQGGAMGPSPHAGHPEPGILRLPGPRGLFLPPGCGLTAPSRRATTVLLSWKC